MRGVLGVGAANYSILLQRSIDFSPFQFMLNGLLPRSARALSSCSALIQHGLGPRRAAGLSAASGRRPAARHAGEEGPAADRACTIRRSRTLGSARSRRAAWAFPPGTDRPAGSSRFRRWRRRSTARRIVPYDVNGAAPPLTNTPPTDRERRPRGGAAARRSTRSDRRLLAAGRPDRELLRRARASSRGVPNVDERD